MYDQSGSLPFVIDNQEHTLRELLTRLLTQQRVRSLDIATAYFNVGGWWLVHEELERLSHVRLLLGEEPEEGADIGLSERSGRSRLERGLLRELAEEEYNAATLTMVERLVAFLRRREVEVRRIAGGFLHAKCYQCYADGGATRIAPLAAIVGSSNFTRAGLESNRELNVVHRGDLAADEIPIEGVRGFLERAQLRALRTLSAEQLAAAINLPGLVALHELQEWYERCWRTASDYKEELIALLDASKFGRKEYTPYEIYTKALFEYFRDELEEEGESELRRSAVELSEFQEDAVKKARRILARYDGVLIADSVGLGKTWIGKKLLEEYAYHRRYKALVICPAALQKLWRDELLSASIAAQIVTQEALGRADVDLHNLRDADLILIDESHNFRNPTAQRYATLERLLAANGRIGGLSGQRKKLILLTATPINNSVLDLYHQINLFTGGDRSFFAAAGIGDLPRYFMAVRRESRQRSDAQHTDENPGAALFNLLEEITIRRTRAFIRQAYPNATIQGQPIHWPERRLRTIRYNLEATYEGIYADIVASIEGLRLAPYRLESYKKQGVAHNEMEQGREEALVGIFKSRYLKRLESSIEAFRISVRRALAFLSSFQRSIEAGRLLNSSSFQKALPFLAREDEEDDASEAPGPNGAQAEQGLLPLAELELEQSEELQAFFASLEPLDVATYDLPRLQADIALDLEALRAVWERIATITPPRDAKLQRLKELLAGDLRGQKVLIFTYYRDTARYLYRHLGGSDEAARAWRAQAGEPRLARMDSGADARTRAELVARFAPQANKRPDLAGSAHEIDILISTDVLSEGQNLQDCGMLVNYDLHWNPTRMIQRAGRIDRIGSPHALLWIINMFPDEGLERLLGLVESLTEKINAIDRSGLLDASILGEVVHPRNFNTLRRIAAEDGLVMEEQEHFAELVSSDFLLQQLRAVLSSSMREKLEELPDGIHSGLARAETRGVFFYFVTREARRAARPARTEEDGADGGQARRQRQHFWRYVDLRADPQGGVIEENRYRIVNLIQCQRDTARYLPPATAVDIFALQERVIASILEGVAHQVVRAEAPKRLDSVQRELATRLQQALLPLLRPGSRGSDQPALPARADLEAALRRVNTPQPRTYLRTLREALNLLKKGGDLEEALRLILTIEEPLPDEAVDADSPGKQRLLRREDLRLVCFEYVWS